MPLELWNFGTLELLKYGPRNFETRFREHFKPCNLQFKLAEHQSTCGNFGTFDVWNLGIPRHNLLSFGAWEVAVLKHEACATKNQPHLLGGN